MLLVKKRTSKNQALAQKGQHIAAKIMEKIEWSKIIYDRPKYIHYTHTYIYINIYIYIYA